MRVASPPHSYGVHIKGLLYYNQPAGEQIMPPPPTPIHRLPHALGIASALDSNQRRLAPVLLPSNNRSPSNAVKLTHQAASPFATSLTPGTSRQTTSLISHRTQGRLPRPSAQFTRQSTLPPQRMGMGFGTGTAAGDTSGTAHRPPSNSHIAPRFPGLNGLLKPSRGLSMSGSDLDYKP